jgi:hypothetical protein
MVGPKLKKTEDKQYTITSNAKRLFQAVYFKQKEEEEEEKDEISRIKVSALISKVAFVYEKIRNAVDYDEEHLLRKNAIERILKRQIVIEGVLKASKSEEISLHLLTELIRAGYLGNDELPETKIKEIASLLEKYIKLKNYALEKVSTFSNLSDDTKVIRNKVKERNKLVNWIISIAATEIEENLGKDLVQNTVIENMYEDLEHNIQAANDLDEKQKKDLKIQIYLSIYRKYVKYNDSMLSLLLFRYYNREWTKDKITDEEIMEIAHKILTIKEAINRQLKHPLIKQIDKVTSKYAVYYSIMKEVISSEPIKLFYELKNNSLAYYKQVKNTYTKRYKKTKSKLWSSAWRSIIYIFFTKSIFVILIEVPAIKWFGEELNYVSLFINIIFPALLLFFMVLTTRKPSSKNLDKVVEGVQEISYEEFKRQKPFIIKKPAKRRPIPNFIFNFIYFITLLFLVYIIVQFLTLINFNWVSIIIFLFFLAFVSFFSVRVKKNIKELIIAERKDNLADFLFDFFYMPIVAAGRWLSGKASKINIFIFIMDFIIESPFKVFVEIAEDWTKYVKEKKEEIM